MIGLLHSPILIMPNDRLGSGKYYLLSHWFDSISQSGRRTLYSFLAIEGCSVSILHYTCNVISCSPPICTDVSHWCLISFVYLIYQPYIWLILYIYIYIQPDQIFILYKHYANSISTDLSLSLGTTRIRTCNPRQAQALVGRLGSCSDLAHLPTVMKQDVEQHPTARSYCGCI